MDMNYQEIQDWARANGLAAEMTDAFRIEFLNARGDVLYECRTFTESTAWLQGYTYGSGPSLKENTPSESTTILTLTSNQAAALAMILEDAKDRLGIHESWADPILAQLDAE